MSDQNQPSGDDTPQETPIHIKSESGDVTPPTSAGDPVPPSAPDDAEDLGPRLERLGGEPAPDITPEEFARLQQSGQIHIDPRGRVRSSQTTEEDDAAGITLRKRRAWYQ